MSILIILSFHHGIACKKIEPAPEDLDGLAHYFWDKFDEGLDEEIALAVINLEAAIDSEGEEGTTSRLTDESVALIG